MNVRDPDTWPQQAGLFYRKLSRYREIAHAFHEGTKSFCNGVYLDPGGGVKPTRGSARLCSNCIGCLMQWGYLSRSENIVR